MTLVLWAGGALALAAVVGLVVVLLLRTGDDAAQTPQEATQRFVDALDEGDCEALTPHLSDGLAEVLDCDSSSATATAIAGIGALNISFGRIEVLEETDDEARVSVEVSAFSTEGEAVLGLVREDDAWVVDELDLDGSRIPLLGIA